MSFKNAIIDFFNYAFAVALIGFCIMYFIVPGRFEAFTHLMKAIAPLFFFIFIFLIKWKLSREEARVLKDNNEEDFSLAFNYWDKMKAELLVYILPIGILALSIFSGEPNSYDFLQALLVFVVLYFLVRNIFSKKRSV